ncbi:replication-relaxation family protein [Actinoplanes subglobosus]|uniref:Replication-relaxation family protein n=1 Tax=Actinoplanes subglobosus TaxID=1547892 RepID=A0ABV8J957_9ACTN
MPAITWIQQMLAFYSRLTDRDLHILQLLDEHRVLTTDQIARLHFTALRTCQIRLRDLQHLGLLERFRYARTGGGDDPWHWTLGLYGARFMAGTLGRPIPTEHAHRDQLLRLTGYVNLRHLRETNEFGVRLAHRARTDPQTRLPRWWSERTTAARFRGIHPDAHGMWQASGHLVGWFLECDMGTESQPRLAAKLTAYENLARTDGPTYPVLFWLPGTVREANLHQTLLRQRPPVPVATATHDTDPAGPVWLTVGARKRVPLADLPSNHGRPVAGNPNWADGELDLSRPDSPGQDDLS